MYTKLAIARFGGFIMLLRLLAFWFSVYSLKKVVEFLSPKCLEKIVPSFCHLDVGLFHLSLESTFPNAFISTMKFPAGCRNDVIKIWFAFGSLVMVIGNIVTPIFLLYILVDIVVEYKDRMNVQILTPSHADMMPNMLEPKNLISPIIPG